ncbi:MAG: acetyl-CoA acetyltransferase [Acidimicrobiia bacterium]
MTDIVIVAAARTPIGKAPKGVFQTTRPDDLAATAISGLLSRVPSFDPALVDDVMLGCAMPEAEQGLNVARIASLRAGLPVSASAVTINRFCASGLEAIAQAVGRIATGSADIIIAGGTESMSLIPMGGHTIAPNPGLVETYPDVYLSTGLVAENHAHQSGISREAQDAFALESHRRAVAAIDDGRFDEELVPVDVATIDGTRRVSVDEGPRRQTSLEALAALKPAFHARGSVTAGNSSQTSDAAAVVLVMTAARAAELGLTPMARWVGYATAGVKPELFGTGPVPAIQKLLARTGVALADIDLIELNEAFAAQVLACTAALPMDPDRLNVNGGAIALGHPLGCTGARLTTSLLHELRRRQGRYGLVTMCVGGGMGAAALLERSF